ncbi:tetratricopeptide repeat protein [bacterium]|nr:tetratricopeptide repeat protein [bacterium]
MEHVYKKIFFRVLILMALAFVYSGVCRAQPADKLNKADKCYAEGILAWSQAIVKNDQTKLNEAIKKLTEVVHLNPEHSEAFNILGRIYWRKQEKKKAEEMWAKAIQLNPKLEKEIDKIKNPAPILPKLLGLKSSKKKLSNKETDAALYCVEATGLLLQARRGDNGKYEVAINKCKEAIKIAPKYANSFMTLGIIYSDLEQYKKSNSLLNKAARLDNNMNSLVKNLKQQNKKLKNMSQEERKTYKETMKKIISEMNLGNNIFSPKKPLQQKPFVPVFENPKDREAYYEWLKKEESMPPEDKGNIGKAREYYRTGFLAAVDFQIGKNKDAYDKAVVNLKKAIKLNPNYEEAYLALGDVYLAKGIFRESEKMYKKAIKINSESIKGHLGLRRCYVDQKQWEKAKKQSLIILKLEPGNEVAQKGLLRAEKELQKELRK